MSRCADLAIQNYPRWQRIGWPVAEIWPFEIFLRWWRPPSWIFRTENSAIRSTASENPTLEPNMKWFGSPAVQIGHSRSLGAYGTHILGEGEVVGVSDETIRKSDGGFHSYRLSIVTVALSVTIRPQFAIECLRRSKQQGVGHFGPKFPGFPLE